MSLRVRSLASRWQNLLYVNVFNRNDNRTIYNVIYRDGKHGFYYIKRFAITSITRDKEYDVTQGNPDSRVLYFSANPNGEAETVRVVLKPRPRQKLLVFDKDFSDIHIKGRGSMGNILTKAEVHRITLKQKGSSTLGGRQVSFDWDVLRLNYDGRGDELGEFQSEDQILVVLQNGEYYTTNFELSNHYEENILTIEKYDANKVWTAALFDADAGFAYLKRFRMEATARKQSFLGENPESRLFVLTDEAFPRLEVVFGGNDAFRDPLVVDAESFIAIKGFKAKGKRLSNFAVDTVNELDPVRFTSDGTLPEATTEGDEGESDEESTTDENGEKTDSEIYDELTGQMNLFKDTKKKEDEE